MLVIVNKYFVDSCLAMTLSWISVTPQQRGVELSFPSHWVRTNRIWNKYGQSKSLLCVQNL